MISISNKCLCWPDHYIESNKCPPGELQFPKLAERKIIKVYEVEEREEHVNILTFSDSLERYRGAGQQSDESIESKGQPQTGWTYF
jgi:hypothetical protein